MQTTKEFEYIEAIYSLLLSDNVDEGSASGEGSDGSDSDAAVVFYFAYCFGGQADRKRKVADRSHAAVTSTWFSAYRAIGLH